MVFTHELTLDITYNEIKTVNIKQYTKNSHSLMVSLTNEGCNYKPDSSTMKCYFKMLTPDNRAILVDAYIKDDGVVQVNIPESACLYAGTGKGELVISSISDNTIFASMNINLNIVGSVYDNDKIISSDDFDALNKLFENASKDYDYVINEAKSYAIGNTGTREGEDTDNAKYYCEQAKKSEIETKDSETRAYDFSMSASQYAATATQKANDAIQSASDSATSATTASDKATESSEYSTLSKSYAVGGTGTRENEDVDNSKYYYEQAKGISEGLQGSLLPMGTITFSALANQTKSAGYMYNISDEFTTDSTFKDGAGYTYPAGTNVYYTADGYWDCLAGTMVTGVKGNAETDYRKGSVNLTPANIGAIGAKYASYWGITDPDGADDVFIRATSKGFLPYQPGRPGGNEPVSDIGSSSNYFRNSYIKLMLCNGLEALDLIRLYGKGIQIDANNTGGFAKGFVYRTYGNTATQGGIGALGSAEGGFHTLYMGLGTQPHSSTAKGIHINEEGNTLIGNTTVDGTLTASSFLGNATSATKASQDGNGDVIADTYAKKSIYGDYTVSMGRKSGTGVGANSFAFGYNTTASVSCSHAEGNNTTASGDASHAEGYYTTASGDASHAEGRSTTASNYASNASGKYNAAMTTGGSSSNTTGTAFVIGNGTSSSALSNAFSVAYTGVVKAKSTITGSTTADYAEFFEWEDGNPDGEDRVGKFVTIRGNKISIAKSNEDYILGIVSGEPFVLGNGDCDTWNGMFLRDEFNRTIYEPAPKMEIDEETGEEKEVFDEEGNVVYEGTRPKLNPEFDYTKKYIPRSDRPEWAPIGMLGVLSVIHDGTCQVDGYCCCNSEGIATACEKGTEGACRVIEEVSDNVVRVILK